ncbi:alpha/beta fold hydrolase [Microbacterium sp. PMB16]|uniref:alpha/beta fold hydrolase n=1 Tax=Microbacterium sp. PMB16 TaxID=3120157 RepID=UPI003F4BBFBC
MPSLPALVGRSIRTTARLSPAISGYLSYRAFFAPGPRMRVRKWDATTHSEARRRSLTVRGIEVTGYEWGTGSRTVLLLHGWRGRASQFAPLVRELVYEGFRVVSFDAPAHGVSKGRRTDARDWVTLAEQLLAIHGPFAMIVGHSFGSLAALTAARSTVPTPAVAVIAGGAGPAAFLDEFVREFRVDRATAQNLTTRFQRRLGLDETAVTAQYDAAQHPLPADTSLLVVHDRTDQRMPDADSLRLHAAHGDRSRLLRTDGFGHTRVLSADATLDAVIALATGGLAAVDALGTAAPRTRPAKAESSPKAEPGTKAEVRTAA